MEEQSIRCSRCGSTKDGSEFAPGMRHPGGYCRPCQREYNRQHYAGENAANPRLVERTCDHCGELYLPKHGKARLAYCSRKCKSDAHNAKMAADRVASKPTDRHCLQCGEPMPQQMRADAKFCSSRCNEAAHALQRKLRSRSAAELILTVPDGMLRCGRCKQVLPVEAFALSSRGKGLYGIGGGPRCRECRAAEYRGDSAPIAHPPRPCRMCGEMYVPKLIRVKSLGVCSRRCAELLRKAGSDAGKPGYLRALVCERDRWRCGICGKRVDRELAHPDPMCASLDHIKPVSQGGTNDLWNLRLTHLRCNLSRRATGPLLLF
jgi:predicted nucleic acid-binding Zn ribbon protein